MNDDDQESFIIKWNSYSKVLKESLSKLLLTGQYSDVSLACEGRRIKCHRAILATFSSHLAQILEEISVPNSIIYLGNGIKFHQLQSLLTFMYNGEIEVTPVELADLLKVAEELKVKGLSITTTTNNNAQNQNKGGHGQDMETDEEDTTMSSDTAGDESNAHVMTVTSSILGEQQTSTPNTVRRQSNFETDQSCGTGAETSNPDDGVEEGITTHREKSSEAMAGTFGFFQAQDVNVSTKSTLISSLKGECQFMTATPKKSPRCRKPTQKMTERLMMIKTIAESQAGCSGQNDVVGSSTGKKKKKRVRVRSRQFLQRPSPYGENMKKALDMILGGGRLTEAASEYGIPNSTLSKYVKNPERLKTSKLYYYNINA